MKNHVAYYQLTTKKMPEKKKYMNDSDKKMREIDLVITI